MRVGFTQEVELFASYLANLSKGDDRRSIILGWKQLPSKAEILHACVEKLAESLHSAWPNWYDRSNLFSGYSNIDSQIHDRLQCEAISRGEPDISLAWLRGAVSLCRMKRLPIVNAFPTQLQIAQTVRALSSIDTLLVLFSQDEQPQSSYLSSLARLVEWLSDVPRLKITLLLPREVMGRSELDRISYGAFDLDREWGEEETSRKKSPPDDMGKPHHLSPGEQKLAERLQGDRELGCLFYFNRTVRTVRGSDFRVDLLWPEGKVIVEIDGYRFHSDRNTFMKDRNRDYELTISGYLVLRLDHEEVYSDTELALEKIRDMVRFRQDSMAS